MSTEKADFLQDFGARLREQRKARGFKQQEALAEALGIHPDNVGRWERGGTETGIYTLVQLMGLGLDVGYMLWGKKGVPGSQELNPAERKLVELFRDVLPADHQVVFRLLASLRPAEGVGSADDEIDAMVERHRHNTEAWDMVLTTGQALRPGALVVPHDSFILEKAGQAGFTAGMLWAVSADRSQTVWTSSAGETRSRLDSDVYRAVEQSTLVSQGTPIDDWLAKIEAQAFGSLWREHNVVGRFTRGGEPSYRAIGHESRVRFAYLAPGRRVIYVELQPLYAGPQFFGGSAFGTLETVFFTYASILGQVEVIPSGEVLHMMTWRARALGEGSKG